MKIDVENLLAAGVVTRASIVTTRVTTKVILFVQGSRVCGRTRSTPVVAVIGSFVLPIRHLSQLISVYVVLEMYKMSQVIENRWNDTRCVGCRGKCTRTG